MCTPLLFLNVYVTNDGIWRRCLVMSLVLVEAYLEIITFFRQLTPDELVRDVKRVKDHLAVFRYELPRTQHARMHFHAHIRT